jgi:hypothetical protein
MKKLTYFSFIVLLFTFAGCELEVKNIKLPEFQQKLVINSFISPYDTISFVSVSTNEKIYGELNETAIPGPISVTISNGFESVSLKAINGRYYFKPEDMPVEEGRTYSLKVTAGDGLSAEATCTIPVSRELYPETDTVWELNQDSWMPGIHNIKARVYITDPAGEANYFRFYCKELEFYNGEKTAMQAWSEENEIFNDIGKDGKKIFVNSVNIIEPSADCDSSFIIFYLLQTDKAYFTYHYSLENFSGGEDPFTEIFPADSNIEGGLGIFASYTVDSVLFRLK